MKAKVMFSSIRDIKFPKYEEAQSTDARLELNHDKSESGSKKNQHKEEALQDTSEYIKESFSIQSLILYLEQYIEDHLLHENLKEQAALHETLPKDKFAKWYKAEAENSNSVERKRAANAYAHTLRSLRKSSQLEKRTTVGMSVQENGKAYTLNNVYQLLWDLRNLDQKGIIRLEIKTQEDFIPAIEKANRILGAPL